MASTNSGQVWGKLVSLNPDTFPDIILNEPEIWFGRDSSCHVDARFTEAIISKKHCKLFSQGGTVQITDFSSNGTFLNGTLIGKGKTVRLPDGGIITLIVPSIESKNFNKNTPAYKLVSATVSEDVSSLSEAQLEEMMKSMNALGGRIDKWLKAAEEYRETGHTLFLKGAGFLDLLAQDEFANETTQKLVSTLKKIEDLKSELHHKTYALLVQPILAFRDNDVNVVLEMDKTTKAAKKKHDELKSKLKKESDPFKEKQLEQKFTEVKNQFELQTLMQASKMKEIQSKTNGNLNNWLVQYTLANLDIFRTGHQQLQSLETEMQQHSQNLSKDIKDREEQNQKKIDRLKELQTTTRNPKHRREKQGYLMKKGKPLWFVIMEGTISYYKSWKESNPLGSIDLVLCSVKINAESKKRLCFELSSPGESHVLTAQSPEDLEDWINVFKNSISYRLEVHRKKTSSSTIAEQTIAMDKTLSMGKLSTPLVQLQVNPQNHFCVDCGAKDPDWASINLGCLMCYECSGVHRALGTHISKVRSLTLDKWEPQLLQIMKLLGNEKVNEIYETKLSSSSKYSKLEPNAERTQRERFIKAKYNRRKFVNNSLGIKDVVELSKLLYSAASGPIVASSGFMTERASASGSSLASLGRQPSGEVVDEGAILQNLLKLLAYGANINLPNAEESSSTVLHYAAAEGNLVVVEFLIQNGANPNAVDSKGWAPLHYCANGNDAGCARLLMNRGAIVSLKDNEGRTPSDVAEAAGSKSVKTLLTISTSK